MAPRRLCRRSLTVSDFHRLTLYSEPLHRVCPLHPRYRRPRGCRGRHLRMGGPLSTCLTRLGLVIEDAVVPGSVPLDALRQSVVVVQRGEQVHICPLQQSVVKERAWEPARPRTRRSGSANRRPGSLAPRRPQRRPDRSTNCRAGGRGPRPPNGGSARSLYRRKQWSTGPPSGVAVTGPLRATIDQRE